MAGGRAPALVVTHGSDDTLGEQRLHLCHIPSVFVLQLKENLLEEGKQFLGILSEPERGVLELGSHRTGLRGEMGSGLQLEIDAVFCHGILRQRNLLVFHMGTGHIKRVGRDLKGLAADIDGSPAVWNIVKLITVVSMTVARHSTGKFLKDDIQDKKNGAVHGDADIQIGVCRFHKIAPLL